MALLLKQRGITRVRPLLGGLDGWRERGYTVEQKLVQVNDALAEPQPSQQSDQVG